MKLDRLLFGKEYAKGDRKQKIKLLRVNYYFLAVCFLIIFIGFIILSVVSNSSLNTALAYGSVSEYNVTINLVNLTDSEQEYVSAIIEQVNPDYLRVQKSITVTKDIQEIYEKDGGEKASELLMGYNELGNVYLQYNPNAETFKISLCHEMLHSIIKGGNEDITHEIVYNLALKKPCFWENEISVGGIIFEYG